MVSSFERTFWSIPKLPKLQTTESIVSATPFKYKFMNVAEKYIYFEFEKFDFVQRR